MGIDMELMRQKLASLRGEGNKDSNSVWFKPDEGDTDIRIVPTNDGDPLKEMFFHYNVGDHRGGIMCPKRNFGEDDPLNDFVRALYRENTEDSIKMAKSLSARQRFFAPVVVRGEEEQGVRIWGFGKQVYETILGLVLNPEYGDITDVQSGIDLTINYGKPAGAQFPQTKLTPKRRSTPLFKETAKVQSALDSVPDFSNVFDRKTPAEVQAMLDEFLLSESGAEETSTETVKYTNSTSEVDKAFQELM